MATMAREMLGVAWYHWKEGNYHPIVCTYVTAVHICALIGVARVFDCKWQTLVLALSLWPISGFGITVGAHRLWAHRSYKARAPYRILLMLMNATASQFSILHWAREHRAHHRHSDTNADPYDATRGLFYSHIGWLLLKKSPRVLEAEPSIDVSDLLSDPVVMFQHRSFHLVNLFMCYIMPPLVAMYGWGETFSNGFFVAGALRWVVILHITFTVNSLAHAWGDRPYDANILATQNPLVSFLSLGEGWHNWHHKYPYDYSACESDDVVSYSNPSKAFIDLFAAIGQVTDRKRALTAWRQVKSRGLEEDHEMRKSQ